MASAPQSIDGDDAALAEALAVDPFADQPPRDPPALRPAALLDRLTALGIDHKTLVHPPVFTVEEARTVRGKLPGGHTKNLCLRDKKKNSYLVVLEADTPVDLKALARHLGVGNLSFASAERLWELLGVMPGSVTPFALFNDPDRRVRLILDEALFALEPLNFHPLVNTMTTAIATADLATVLQATGHDPLRLDLAGLSG